MKNHASTEFPLLRRSGRESRETFVAFQRKITTGENGME